MINVFRRVFAPEPPLKSAYVEEILRLRNELALEKEKHSKASYHINAIKKHYEEQVADLKQKARDAAETANREVARLKRERDVINQAYVDTCRAVSMAGLGREPMFQGDSIAPNWGGFAARALEKMRHQNIGIKAACAALVPWLNREMKSSAADDEILYDFGPARGSVHRQVIRRKDVRVLRELLEQIQ